ncbi:MAG: hypothetical protein U0401_33000 [Anaerolineae bacterium]
MNHAAVLKVEPKPLSELRQALKVPEVELSQLPAKLSKRLWVNPEEFLVVTSAPLLAQWALQVSGLWRPRLAEPSSRRGPKPVYFDWSVMLVALIQVAWQMSYEEVIDYFRSHPQAARVAGFPEGRVISIGQYWDRRRALGVLPFWFLFIGFVGQLVYLGVIKRNRCHFGHLFTLTVGFELTQRLGGAFPNHWKGSVWGYKVHTLLCRWSQLPIIFLVTPAHRQDSPFAIALLSLAVLCFGFSITLVRADAGYFTAIPVIG